MNRTQIITKAFDKVTRSKSVHEAVLFVENLEGDFSLGLGYAGRDVDSPLYTASVGKLFTTACILVLQEQKQLALDGCLGDYFDKSVLDGLHIFRGVDYSRKLTISDLLFQTSGLPDWFEEGGLKMHMIQEDFYVSFEQKLTRTKELRPHFAPGTAKRAYYSDINFDLLGKIIENVTHMPLEAVFADYLFRPLGLTRTYQPTSENDFIPNIFYKNESLYRPNSILCCRGSGDCVSTARELMMFLKAFWGGTFFPKNVFQQLSEYRKLQRTMGPIYYGGGYMQIPLNTFLTFFMGKGELIGHSGSTGSFAFYYPLKNLYFVGDFNQLSNPALPIRLIMKLAMTT
jgi:CubicO group peptidase (beta-lactamase class C family)